MVTKREKIEAWREMIQSPKQMEYEKSRSERAKKIAEYKKQKRKEFDQKQIKKWEKRLSKAGKGIKKVGKGIRKGTRKIKMTKSGVSYKIARKLLPKIERAMKGKKISSVEIERRRAYEIRRMKLAHKQKLAYLAAQADLTARETDGRYQLDASEDAFLNEPYVEPLPQEEDYYEQNYQLPQQSRLKRNYVKDFLNGLSNLGGRTSRGYSVVQRTDNLPPELKREINRRQNILNASKNTGIKLIPLKGDNRINKITLMGSEKIKINPPKVRFTTAPRLRVFGKYNAGGVKY